MNSYDECIDQRLRNAFPEPEYEVFTVGYMGWKGLKNGNLLKVAEKDFDVVDRLKRSPFLFSENKDLNIVMEEIYTKKGETVGVEKAPEVVAH